YYCVVFFVFCPYTHRCYCRLPFFPTRRSSDLAGGPLVHRRTARPARDRHAVRRARDPAPPGPVGGRRPAAPRAPPQGRGPRAAQDRKSTPSELQSRFDLVCRLLLEKKK